MLKNRVCHPRRAIAHSHPRQQAAEEEPSEGGRAIPGARDLDDGGEHVGEKQELRGWLRDLFLSVVNLFARAALRMATVKPECLTLPVRAGLLHPYDSWAHRVAVHQFVQDIPLSPRDRSYATLASIEIGLPRLADRPWMFVWGMRDWCFTPAMLARFADIDVKGGRTHSRRRLAKGRMADGFD